MASLGEILTKAREARGVSIDEVSKTTKIQPRFIKALEQEDFQPFPAPVYLKSFLRTYIQYLGLEPEKVLSVYKETWARSELAKKTRYLEKKYLLDTRYSSQKYLTVVLCIIFFIGIALLSYLYQANIGRQKGQYSQHSEKVAGISDTKINDKSQKESLATSRLQNPQESILTLEDKPNQPAASIMQKHSEAAEQNLEIPIQHPELFIPEEPRGVEQTPKEGAKKSEETRRSSLVLTIDALEDTWLRVSSDGVVEEDILLRAGNKKEWKAKEKFVLIIGHVAGTRLKLNDKEIPLPYTKTDVLTDFALTKKNIP